MWRQLDRQLTIRLALPWGPPLVLLLAQRPLAPLPEILASVSMMLSFRVALEGLFPVFAAALLGGVPLLSSALILGGVPVLGAASTVSVIGYLVSVCVTVYSVLVDLRQRR